MKSILKAALCAAAAAFCVGFGSGSVSAKEEKIPVTDVPKAVMDVVVKRFPQAKVDGAERGELNGKVHYDVWISEGAAVYEVCLADDGTINEIAKSMPLADVPRSVSEAVAAKFPTQKIAKAEAIFKPGIGVFKQSDKDALVHYRLTLNDDKQVIVLPNGSIKAD